MANRKRLISWFHPCSTSNVALNTRTCTHGPLRGHPNWAGYDNHVVMNHKIIVKHLSIRPHSLQCSKTSFFFTITVDGSKL
jgi:hypothetical protein